MMRLLTPARLGLQAARHTLWYLSYQMTGQARREE